MHQPDLPPPGGDQARRAIIVARARRDIMPLVRRKLAIDERADVSGGDDNQI